MPKLTPISNKNFAAYSMQNAKGIDIIVKDLQTKFNATFAWLEKGFGRAVKMGETSDEVTNIFPAVFVEDDGDYQNVLTLDNYDAYCFFYAEDPEGTLDYNPIVDNQLERTLHIIFWFKQSKVLPNATEPIIERVKQDIRKAIGDVRLSCDNSILDVTAYDEPDEIFNPLGFTFDFVKTQNLNNDYAALRFELEVQFYHNSDSYNTTELIQSLTYSNNYQEISSSFTSMSPTLLPTNATGTYTADSLPDGLVLDANTGIISEDDYASIPNGLSSFTITFTGSGNYSGTTSYFVVLCKVVASSNTANGLTYDNDDQTIWQASGSEGVFTNMNPTVDPCNATGTYSSVDLPDGLSLDSNTGIISVETYGNIPIGESTFTVTFTGSGSFTGSADYEVTITKRELWKAWDVLEPSIVRLDLDASLDNGDQLTLVGDKVSQWDDLSGNGDNATQTNNSKRPYVAQYESQFIGGKRTLIPYFNCNMDINIGSSISQPFYLFIVTKFVLDDNNMVIFGDNVSNFLFGNKSRDCAIRIINSSVTNISLEEKDYSTSDVLISILINGSSSVIDINGGEFSQNISVGAGSLGSLIKIFSSYLNGNYWYGPTGHFRVVDGLLSSDNWDMIRAEMCWKWGLNDRMDIPAYSLNPPFKPLP